MPADRSPIRLLLAVTVFALLYRLHPLALGPDAWAQAFVTEDGYLMLTVARNLATGLGLSVSAGEIATNGVQPLATFLYALPYLAAGGDRSLSLIGINLLGVAFAAGGFLAIRAFAAAMLRDIDPAPIWPLLAAVLWLAGPVALRHTMNALETGLYVAVLAATSVYFSRACGDAAPYGRRQQVVLGLLCGLVFLARIDGALFVAALFGTRFVHMTVSGRLGFVAAVREALAPGLISLAVAAPWLAYNQFVFGSIMPISGTAQSASARFGQNAELLPAKLFETMVPMTPIPDVLETHPLVQSALAGLVVAAMVAFLWRRIRAGGGLATLAAAHALFAVALAFYYGFLFGAPHFLSRYMAPLAPFLIVAGLGAALTLTQALRGAWPRRALALGGAGAAGLAAALLLWAATWGARPQGHFQVVDWVHAHVDPGSWVGAVQTGTLGYWHDRTINLDGKVNPAALRARLEDGHVLGYVIDSPIAYIVDWEGVAGWSARTEADFNRRFSLIVHDRRLNLAVLQRSDGG